MLRSACLCALAFMQKTRSRMVNNFVLMVTGITGLDKKFFRNVAKN